jgi:hypothetical protein
MTNRTRRRLGIVGALCLVAALGAWSCEQAGSSPGTPAGPTVQTAAAASGVAAATSQTPNKGSKPPADGDLLLVLTAALQDEYHAEWAYQDVLDAFGNVKPFVSIENAEEQHIDAVSKLFSKRGSAVPDSIWTDVPPLVFDTLADACAAGVLAEQENVEMYDRLLDSELPDDVVNVFTKLRDASLTNHLPAFQKCVDKAK